jgi:lysozyme
VARDRAYLAPLVRVPLSSSQWAALLSFSYNLGPGNADNLVPEINARDWVALQTNWKQYINAGGVPNQRLIERRAAEWQLFAG